MATNELFSEQSEEIEVFPWTESFNTGLPKVDEQHKRLVEIINELALLMSTPVTLSDVEKVIQELMDYTEYHFSYEESVWQPYFKDDSSYIAHEKKHSQFIETVIEMRSTLNAENLTTSLENILKLLISWLIYHILDSDKYMALTIQAMDSGLSLSGAKEKAAEEIENRRVLSDTIINMYSMLTVRSLRIVKDEKKIRRLYRNAQEESVRELENQRKLIEEAHRIAHLGNWVLDHKTGELKWSDQIYEIFGVNPDKVKPSYQFFISRVHPEDRSLVKQTFKESLEKKVQYQITHRILLPEGGVKYVRESGDSEFDGEEPIVTVGNVQDITKEVVYEKQLRDTSDQLRKALIGTVAGVAKAMEARDPYTAGHQHRVAEIAAKIAERLGMNESQIEGIRLGAGIHDIGKISIPAEILTKPTTLTKAEYMLIQTHAEAGDDILEGIEFPWPIRDIVSQHHERLDGSGYPKGLKGDQISIEARIVAVADVYEAMSTHRPYRAAVGSEKAVEEIKSKRGVHFDMDVVDAFLILHQEGAFDL